MTDFTGGPGFLAFVFTFALALAAVLLSRSLTKHLRRVKADERRDAERAAQTPDAGASAVGPDVAESAVDSGDETTSRDGGAASGGAADEGETSK